MTLKDIHKYEIEKVGEIFKKSKISFIPELKISIETNKTDIDILGMSKNILILVECFGTESFGEKLKKTITNLKNIKENFKKVREIIKQEYLLFLWAGVLYQLTNRLTTASEATHQTIMK